MIKSVIGILVGLIIALSGIIITAWESFGSETFWIGIMMVVVGMIIIGVFILGKIKKWF